MCDMSFLRMTLLTDVAPGINMGKYIFKMYHFSEAAKIIFFQIFFPLFLIGIIFKGTI